jgi:hypothetical protein
MHNAKPEHTGFPQLQYCGRLGLGTMSVLEVLYNYPTQWKTFLSTIGKVYPSKSSLIAIELDQDHNRLSHQLDFQIQVRVSGKTSSTQLLMKAPLLASCPLPIGNLLALQSLIHLTPC